MRETLNEQKRLLSKRSGDPPSDVLQGSDLNDCFQPLIGASDLEPSENGEKTHPLSNSSEVPQNQGVQLTQRTGAKVSETMENENEKHLKVVQFQESEEDFMTAREKDGRTNSENFYSAMQTSKKSLSKSTSNENLAELKPGKEKESFVYS